MAENSSLLSKTISFMRFPMAFFIVWIHVNPEILNGGGAEGFIPATEVYSGFNIFKFCTTAGIARIFVPLFFFMSGFLFFYNVEWTKDVYKNKLQKRIKSLLVPYLLWNTILLVATFIAQTLMPSMVSGTNKALADYNFLDLLNGFGIKSVGNAVDCPMDAPLWFIRDLIYLSIASPLIYLAIKYLRVYAIAIFAALWFIFSTNSTNYFFGLFFFPFGAWFSINKIDFVEATLKHKHIWTPLCVVFMSIGVYLLFNNLPFGDLFHKLGIVVGMFAFVVWSSWFVKRGVALPSILTSSTFFIFAYHFSPLHIASRALPKILHIDTSAGLILLFLLLVVVFVAFGVAAYWIMKKISPKFTALICGR